MTPAALAGLALLALAGGAQAHSWYPADCCSDRDCWPMGADADAREPDPRIVPGGYLTHDGIFVAQRDTRPSRDGRFNVCRYGGARESGVIGTAKGVCLFVPQPTFRPLPEHPRGHDRFAAGADRARLSLAQIRRRR